ncbi:response regulator, partial [Pseudoroseomonas deserti]
MLVAEDEYLVARDLLDTLEEQGATVLGPASTVQRALALCSSTPRIDAALLDVNLRGDWIFAAADLLQERGVPVVFVTGYDAEVIPHRFSAAPCLRKPAEGHRVVEA